MLLNNPRTRFLKRSLQIVQKQLVLSLLLLISFSGLKASHNMGVDLTYQCLNSCTIRVELRAYRDCTGITPIPTSSFQFVPQTPGCALPVAVGSWSALDSTEVTPVCPGTPTGCNSASTTINGVQEYYWYRDYDICAAGGCVFTLEWDDCCRNGTITSGAANDGIFIGSTTLNTTVPGCNSTPQFNQIPTPYMCAGQPFIFNQGATDPDGDSLSYSLRPCYSDPGVIVGYDPGYTATQPLGSSWDVSIDPVTGDVLILPTPGNPETVVLCVYVEEWRGGVMINEIVRDIQLTAMPCSALFGSTNSTPSVDPLLGVTGGTVTGTNEVHVCLGDTLSFRLEAEDPDIGDTLTMMWDESIVGASFFETGNPAVTDTVIGFTPEATFRFVPTAPGFYSFLLTVKDNACPLPARVQITIKINVSSGPVGFSATATPIGCMDYQFSANPGTFPSSYTYLWQGTGNLSLNANATNQNLTHTYPSPGNYNWSVTIIDSSGCTGVVQDSFNISSGPTADAGTDISICSGFPTTIGSSPISGQTYSWTPTSGLGASTSATTGLSLTNPGPLPDTIDYFQIANDGFCDAQDQIRVIVYPIPTVSLPATTGICVGDTATITASGGSSYLWDTGDTSATIQVSPPSTTSYTVNAIDYGCISAPQNITVFVSTGPPTLISGDNRICPGEDAVLTAVGGTSWEWSDGATTQTISFTGISSDTSVWVIATQLGCSGDTVFYPVNLNDEPVPDFNFNEACFGDATNFADLTSIATGSITNWDWDFGDPVTGSLNFANTASPSHTFSATGTYSVTLTVSSNEGCVNTLTQSVLVNENPLPDFNYENVCDGESVNFEDATPGTIVSWSWNFDDGSFDSDQDPSHTYAGPDAYNVILSVVDDNGCSGQHAQTVFVHPNPQADFSYVNSCFNTITTFADQTILNDPYGTSLASWDWDFGHPASGLDNTASGPGPVHNYPPGGVYNVTLTSTSSAGCVGEVTLPVNVEIVNPLIPHNDTVCLDFQAQPYVTNVYPGAEVNWYYTETSPNPFYTGDQYTTPPLGGSPTYWVSMVDASGCESSRTKIKAVLWSKVKLFLEDFDRELEIPGAIAEFNPTIEPADIEIIAWNWDFGDDAVSSQQFPVHQYTEEGLYTISANLIDEYGCEWTYVFANHLEVVKNVQLLVPTAFTPNDDGLNDFFTVSGRLIENFNIQIFDRWGGLVYQSSSIDFQWNGTDKTGKMLPEGTYAIKISAKVFGGEDFSHAGSVTIIR